MLRVQTSLSLHLIILYFLSSSKSSRKAHFVPASTMNSIKYACNLNNLGVGLLISGESSRAIKLFQGALSLLKTADHEAESTSCTDLNTSCDDTSSLPFYESTSTVSGLQGLQCYIYDHGILISDNVNDDTVETISLSIAIVLFNSALAFHSEGTPLGREKSLMRASVLYSLAAQFLIRCTMPEDASSTILTLLTLNNQALIYYDQCEFVQSVDCMNKISKITGSVRGLHAALNHKVVEGLLLNVMLLSTPTAAQAA
jgi:hypothetical protein